MKNLLAFRNSLVVFALIAVALTGIWYSPSLFSDYAFGMTLAASVLILFCVTGWDIIQVVVNGPDETEEIAPRPAPVVDKWATLRTQSEGAGNEASFSLSRHANDASSRSKSDYDPTGPVTMD